MCQVCFFLHNSCSSFPGWFSRKSICLGAKEENLMDYLQVIPGMDQPGTMAIQESIVSEFHGVKIDISLELDTDSIMFCDYFTPQPFCSQMWDFCGVKINISLELDANSITFMLISLISFSVPKSGDYSPEYSLVLDVFSGLKTPLICDVAAAWNAGKSLSRDGQSVCGGKEHFANLWKVRVRSGWITARSGLITMRSGQGMSTNPLCFPRAGPRIHLTSPDTACHARLVRILLSSAFKAWNQRCWPHTGPCLPPPNWAGNHPRLCPGEVFRDAHPPEWLRFPRIAVWDVGQCQSQGKSHLPLFPLTRAVFVSRPGNEALPTGIVFATSWWGLISLPHYPPGAYKPLLILLFFQVLSLDWLIWISPAPQLFLFNVVVIASYSFRISLFLPVLSQVKTEDSAPIFSLPLLKLITLIIGQKIKFPF